MFIVLEPVFLACTILFGTILCMLSPIVVLALCVRNYCAPIAMRIGLVYCRWCRTTRQRILAPNAYPFYKTLLHT